MAAITEAYLATWDYAPGVLDLAGRFRRLPGGRSSLPVDRAADRHAAALRDAGDLSRLDRLQGIRLRRDLAAAAAGTRAVEPGPAGSGRCPNAMAMAAGDVGRHRVDLLADRVPARIRLHVVGGDRAARARLEFERRHRPVAGRAQRDLLRAAAQRGHPLDRRAVPMVPRPSRSLPGRGAAAAGDRRGGVLRGVGLPGLRRSHVSQHRLLGLHDSRRRHARRSEQARRDRRVLDRGIAGAGTTGGHDARVPDGGGGDAARHCRCLAVGIANRPGRLALQPADRRVRSRARVALFARRGALVSRPRCGRDRRACWSSRCC